MKRITKVTIILAIVLITTFVGSIIVFYSGLFPILNRFNITSITNTYGTTFNIKYDKVRRADKYLVTISESNGDVIYKREFTDNNIYDDLEFILENKEYLLDVYAYKKNDESKKANNTLTFTYTKEVEFSKDNTFLLDNETSYIYLSRTVTPSNYSIKVSKNKYNDENEPVSSEFVKEDLISNDVYEVNSSLFKDEKCEIVLELIKNGDIIDTIKLYNNMYPSETPTIYYPESGSTIEYEDIYLKFKDLPWAEKYDIEILNADSKVIAKTESTNNEVLIDKTVFGSGVYTILVNAYLNDFSTKESSMIKIENKLTPVYINKDVNSFKSGDSIELFSSDSSQIYYTLDGSDPNTNSYIYAGPIKITEDTYLKTFSSNGTISSDIKEYNIKVNNYNNKTIYISSSNQVNNLGVTPFTNERFEMNLVADLIQTNLEEKGFKVIRNNYLSSYKSNLDEANKNNADLILSLESTSSDSHEVSGIQTIIESNHSNGYDLANIINNNLNVLKPSKLIHSNNIKGSKTKEEKDIKSIMLELGYHDNQVDADYIVNNRESLAKAISDSIINYYGN